MTGGTAALLVYWLCVEKLRKGINHKTAPRDRTRVWQLTLLAVQVRLMAALPSNPPVSIVVLGAEVRPDTAFGVFLWLEVLNFDLFFCSLSFVLHFSSSSLGCLLYAFCR
jgi:hypothetical protein